jgi:penicillin-binding protein 1C
MSAMRAASGLPRSASAPATLRQHLRELRDRNVEDGSVVVLDNASGEVLAWWDPRAT